MKTLILAVLLAAVSFAPAAAQKQIKRDASGNFYEVRDTTVNKVAVLTKLKYTNSKGLVFPVWRSAKGKYFVNVVPASGKAYKKYLN